MKGRTQTSWTCCSKTKNKTLVANVLINPLSASVKVNVNDNQVIYETKLSTLYLFHNLWTKTV